MVRGGMAQSRSYTSPGRTARSLQTSQRILAAARLLFARHGYGGTTIGAVAREAKVSVQTIYQRFGDKAALLRGQLDDIDRAADLVALRAAVGDTSAPAIVQARALAHFVGRISETVVGLLAAIQTLDDPELKSLWDGGTARHLQGTAGLAAQWAARGLLRDGLSVGEAATTLAAICSVAMFGELRQVHGLAREEAEAWIVDAVLRLLLKADAA